MSGNLADLSAGELLRLFRGKKASPLEAAKDVLARIADLNDDVNVFRLIDEVGTLEDAKQSERRWFKGEPLGLVDGIPVSVKDVLLTKGWSTLWGSKLTSSDQPWDEDAPPVARLREYGAVFVGKTNTSEFHWKTVTDSPLTGITRNPWNPELTPGGSCGGAAVAVATGMGPLALGTDGGGSIRVPCSFTGVFGLKPTFGRVPQYPAGAFGSMAHVGPITRTVADAALMLTVIS
ncbi:MAG TPA: amidase, partial [Rhodospirillales bacterium]|nr:amidase [Rhodospirillales bacterium]